MSLSAEDLAARSGTSVEAIGRLVDLGMVPASDDGGFEETFVPRVRLAMQLEASGIPLEELEPRPVGSSSSIASRGPVFPPGGRASMPSRSSRGTRTSSVGTVNVAARLADYVRRRKVLVTASVVDASSDAALEFREIGPVALKGVAEPLTVFSAQPSEGS